MNRSIIWNFIGLFLIWMFSGCQSGNVKENLSLADDFKQITVAEDYSLMIPKYMKRTTSLNSEASFQCSNMIKTAYCIVIEESKKDFIASFRIIEQYQENKSVLENYTEVQLGFITEDLEVISQTEIQNTKINGLNVQMLSLDGISIDLPQEITYFITFYEGTENIYMMMNWTLASNKLNLADTFNKIALSFEEMN